MIFRRFTLSLVIRIVVMLLIMTLATLAAIRQQWVWSGLLIVLIVILIAEEVHFVNSIPRKLSYFFDAVKNEDSSLHFPESTKDRQLARFHQSLNHLNTILSEIKIRNERNEKFFRELLKSSTTGIIAIDEKGFVELVNQAALQLLQLTALSHMNRLRQEHRELTESLETLLPGQSQTLKILIGNELRQLSVRVSDLHFGDRQYRIFSMNDIRSEMEEIELESWQKLIRVLTHEIMNSIAPITSLSSTLQRFFKTEQTTEGAAEIPPNYIEQAIEGLSVIEETGKGLMHFVDNYRKLAKVPKPKFKSIEIEDWMSRIDLLVRNKLEEAQIQFRQEKKTGRKEFVADENLLNQVVINLINNAVDALKDSEKRQILMRVNESKEYNLEITVSDSGSGIPTEELEKIFIPFYTTKESGSGIGLSLARQIMRLHKGSIGVTSQQGKGTSFTLKL